MKLTYPILVEKGNADTAWGVAVPDLAGCFSAADSEQDIINNAREAILLHLAQVDDIPTPSSIHDVEIEDGFDYVWLVDVDLSEVEGEPQRININVPRKALKIIDIAAERQGKSRSNFLTEAGIKEASY